MKIFHKPRKLFYTGLVVALLTVIACKNPADTKRHFPKSSPLKIEDKASEYFRLSVDSKFELDRRLALMYIDSAIAIDSSNVDFIKHKAKLKNEIGETEEAKALILTAFALMPDDDTRVQEVRKLIADTDYGRSQINTWLIEQKNSFYSDEPEKNIENLKESLLLYTYLGDTVNYLEIGEAIIRSGGADAQFRNQMGLMYYGQRQYKKALIEFDDAVELRPDGVYYFNKAQVLLALGKERKARQSLKAASDLGNKEACNQYREMTAALCCDGTTSNSTGRGTCSHHRGVCGTEATPYKSYTHNCN
jgi:tetratricopeptide (TPR) repeat protein